MTGDSTESSAADGVDWVALWSAYGFDTPDAIGATYASKTQLVGALQTERDVDGDAGAIIEAAAAAGTLHRMTATSDNGADITRGFLLADRGDRDE